jgi:DNA repair and recombination RAD54-like protein
VENVCENCYVEPFLANYLRDHQKEGIKFMFECITQLKNKTIKGCILADAMGLGKSL